jgi:hypothetical protein
MSEVSGVPRKRDLSWFWMALLIIALVNSLGFFIAFALPFLLLRAKFLARFEEVRHFWLLAHIAGGSLALLVGPFQLWMGSTRRHMPVHRKLGMLYLLSVAVASVGAFFLAVTTRRGPIFGFGLGSLAFAWIITTGLAYFAVRHRMFVQHQEWMIRSYVVTFAFVTFRMSIGLFQLFKIGTSDQRIETASWLCWAVPLLLTEAIIQGRRIFSTRTDAGSLHVDLG